MFTGIITDIGIIADVDKTKKDMRIKVLTGYNLSGTDLGASIACSGCCLTVVDKGHDNSQHWFAVDVSEETVSRTKPSQWIVGAPINLEQSLKMGDELGGHMVSGHVDGMATCLSVTPKGGSHELVFAVDNSLKNFIASKGSVALDGVSLTVNAVDNDRFTVNIIPHTWDKTTLGRLQCGDKVNLEIDMLARYVARILEKDAA